MNHVMYVDFNRTTKRHALFIKQNVIAFEKQFI